MELDHCPNLVVDWPVGQRVGTCEDCEHRKEYHPRYQVSQIRGMRIVIFRAGNLLPRQILIPTFLSHRLVRPMGTANRDEGSKLKAIVKLGVQCGLVSGFELCRLRGVSRGLCEWIANQRELWHLLHVRHRVAQHTRDGNFGLRSSMCGHCNLLIIRAFSHGLGRRRYSRRRGGSQLHVAVPAGIDHNACAY
jgi:hypothetical protein